MNLLDLPYDASNFATASVQSLGSAHQIGELKLTDLPYDASNFATASVQSLGSAHQIGELKLTDLPYDIWTHIVSHLCKKSFYNLCQSHPKFHHFYFDDYLKSFLLDKYTVKITCTNTHIREYLCYTEEEFWYQFEHDHQLWYDTRKDTFEFFDDTLPYPCENHLLVNWYEERTNDPYTDDLLNEIFDITFEEFVEFWEIFVKVINFQKVFEDIRMFSFGRDHYSIIVPVTICRDTDVDQKMLFKSYG